MNKLIPQMPSDELSHHTDTVTTLYRYLILYANQFVLVGVLPAMEEKGANPSDLIFALEGASGS